MTRTASHSAPMGANQLNNRKETTDMDKQQDNARTDILTKAKIKARERGAEVLSEGTAIGRRRLQLRCQAGHTWEAPADRIVAGHWCPACSIDKRGAARREKMLARARQRALERGGQCLAESYDFSGQKLRFRCSCGNEWETKPVDVVKDNGTWCPRCFKTNPRTMSVKDRHNLATATRRQRTVERMHAIARERGGKCLTTEHHHHKSRFEFECVDGHTWYAIAGHIAQGKWCPQCSNRQSRGEKLSRLILEALFNKPFPSRRPEWLRGSNGVLLELDCFNEELGLAFEYQGHQHYGHQSLFHRDKSFARQAARDEEKRKLVANAGRGITLIEIPYFPENIAIAAAVTHIKQLLAESGIPFDDSNEINIDTTALYSIDLTAKIMQIIADKGGKLLSPGVLGSTIKIEVACGCGHAWPVTPSKLMNGRWCPECANKQKGKKNILSLEIFHRKAAENGGRCLATENKGIGVHHEWECQQHGVFWAKPRDIIHGGTWCPKCGKENSSRTKLAKTFARVKEYAKEKGGECLSPSYDRSRQKLEFRCCCGNRWLADPAPMLRVGTWCPACGAKRRGFAAGRSDDGNEQMTIPGI